MKLLYHNHYFSMDIRAMRRARPQHEIQEISPFLFINWTAGKFPPEMVQYPDEEERLPPEIRKGWEQYNEKVFYVLHSQFPFEAFVTPLDDTHYIRRFIRLCRSRGIPTIMQLKEGTFAEYVLQNSRLFHHPKEPSVISDLVIGATERTRKFWMNSGVPSEKIVITGQARFDAYRHRDLLQPLEKFGVERKPGRRMLLFLAYHPTSLGTSEEAEQGKLDLSAMRVETLEVFGRFLRRHPDVDLVVKFHPQQDAGGDAPALKGLLSRLAGLPVGTVEGTEGVPELLFACDAVVGKGTTALVEAMAIGKPAIFTLWRKYWEGFDARILPHHKSGACEVADSPEALEGLLEQALYRPESLPDRRAARGSYVAEQLGPVDGACAERSWQAIEGFLAGRRSGSNSSDDEVPPLISHLERTKSR